MGVELDSAVVETCNDSAPAEPVAGEPRPWHAPKLEKLSIAETMGGLDPGQQEAFYTAPIS
jgi:hypothetical protein